MNHTNASHLKKRTALPSGLHIVKQIGKGKSAYSYLAQQNGKPVVLKVMHDEPCPYYHFSGNRAEPEINAYQVLTEVGIAVPQLLSYDIAKEYLIKEYIAGPTAAELIACERPADALIAQLFDMARRLKKRNLNIDYFPTNFVINNETLYYIDYEINAYQSEWDLENWGLFYWANSRGFAEFLKSGNHLAINKDAGSGIPVKAPFRDQVQQWINQFG